MVEIGGAGWCCGLWMVGMVLDGSSKVWMWGWDGGDGAGWLLKLAKCGNCGLWMVGGCKPSFTSQLSPIRLSTSTSTHQLYSDQFIRDICPPTWDLQACAITTLDILPIWTCHRLMWRNCNCNMENEHIFKSREIQFCLWPSSPYRHQGT